MHGARPASYGRAFALGIILNLIFVVVEVAYGITANSVALFADAGHNLSDVLALDSNLNVLPTQTQALQLQIPEPSMLALLAIGLAALTLIMRRQGRA